MRTSPGKTKAAVAPYFRTAQSIGYIGNIWRRCVSVVGDRKIIKKKALPVGPVLVVERVGGRPVIFLLIIKIN